MISDYMEDLTYEPINFGRTSYNKYIYKLNNKYHVRKSINGKTEYFGRYDTFEEARKIRDKLMAFNWNKSCIQDLLDEKDKVKNYYKHIRKNHRYYAVSGPKDKYMGQAKTIEEALYYRDILFENNITEARPKDFDLITDNPYLKYGLEVPVPERLIINLERTSYGTGHIEKKGPQSYHVWYGSTYYYACPTYEMAYYVREKLNECNWDKSQLGRIVDEYPVWYTWLNNFYKYIIPDGDAWLVSLTPRNTGYDCLERIRFRKVEDALWERDLLVKYGFDEELVCECANDEDNPYYDMVIPPYPQRKIRRIKDREPRTELFNTLFTLIQENPELSQEEYCELAGTNSVNLRNIFRKEYDTTWAEFKLLCEGGEHPNDVLEQKPIIYKPDLTLHRDTTNIAVYERLKNKYVVTRWKDNRNHYYGAYPTRELAEKIVKDLRKVDWDKSQLKKIQAKHDWQSIINSKRWVYPQKYNSKKEGVKIVGYSVRHKNKAKKMINFGFYKDKRVADLVRDCMIECDWDKTKLEAAKTFAHQVIDREGDYEGYQGYRLWGLSFL